jgi:hypothetical protein
VWTKKALKDATALAMPIARIKMEWLAVIALLQPVHSLTTPASIQALSVTMANHAR